MSVIQGREPASLFRFFEEISAIPRMSYHEEKIADYLVEFAKQRGLEYHRDAQHNVFIQKPATHGYEEHPAVLLQGHTDMVCEKNNGVEHDFLKDPLSLYIDGGFLRAKGTTLGADDGVAVAVMLAVLDGAMDAHPPVECLFTSAEEVGLDGAKGFDYRLITARKMINVDSESLGVITAGCAGGIRSEVKIPVSMELSERETLRLSVSGLAGGHSGENIHEGRANANKLMGRLLAVAAQSEEARLVSVRGGSKDNAIPRECEAVIAVTDRDAVEDLMVEEAARIAEELIPLDRQFRFTIEDCESEAVMMSAADTARVVAYVCGVTNGVIEMNAEVPGLVEYSRNLGVIETEADAVRLIFCSRSAMESRIDASNCELDALAAAIGAKTKHYARYPGWRYSAESSLRPAYAEAYRRVTGGDVTVKVIHAGLECGIIYAAVKGMDIISIAPNLQNLHSPDEALDLDSVEIFWKTLAELMKNL